MDTTFEDFNNRTVPEGREASVANRLRNDRNAPLPKGGEGGFDEDGNQVQEESLRERVKKAMDVKNRAKDFAKEKISAAVGNPGREVTAMWMRGCWFALIPSFGLSIFLLDAIVFLHAVLGDETVCPLGHEWIPGAVKKASPEAEKSVGGKLAIIEWIVFLVVNFVMGAIVLSVLGILVLIVDFATSNVWENIWDTAQIIFSLGWDSINAIITLFAGLIT